MSLLAFAAIALTATIAAADRGIHEGPVVGGANVPSNQEVLYRSYGECNDAFTSGITIRTVGGGNITIPPQVAANAVWAEIFWVTLADAPDAGAVTVNGNAVAPLANGPVTVSPCWPQDFAFSYRANVLPFIQGGVNQLRGFAESGVDNVSPSTEGVTMVVVYRTNTADKEIVVLGGNDSAILNQIDLAIPVVSAPGFGAELTLVVADGQPASDVALWNGLVISAPDAFQGLDPGPGIGYWDTQEYGVATGGGNVASVIGQVDCLNWVATVLGVKRGGCVVPVEPSTWSKVKNRFN
ncbi:MAG TPA: hypothetical protein VF720_01490 [Candidatus Eisenbacteria bacterium]